MSKEKRRNLKTFITFEGIEGANGGILLKQLYKHLQMVVSKAMKYMKLFNI